LVAPLRGDFALKVAAQLRDSTERLGQLIQHVLRPGSAKRQIVN
jgi:hypothetical protein